LTLPCLLIQVLTRFNKFAYNFSITSFSMNQMA